jgi:hypothetical protein
MVTLLIFIHLSTVFLSYGVVLGQMRAVYGACKHDQFYSFVVSLAGPISLLLFYFVTNGARFGLRFW